MNQFKNSLNKQDDHISFGKHEYKQSIFDTENDFRSNEDKTKIVSLIPAQDYLPADITKDLAKNIQVIIIKEDKILKSKVLLKETLLEYQLTSLKDQIVT